MTSENMTGYKAGIDIGGTKTMFCITDALGEIALIERRATTAHSRPALFFQWLFGELQALLAGISLEIEQLIGIGIGFPGVIGDAEGILSHAPALPWPAVNIRPLIRNYYKGLLYLDNDVNLALLGERYKGAAQNKEHVLMITVGTGIGSALLLNGQLYKGVDYTAGEVGYFVVEVGETQQASASGTSFGPLEAVASGSGITAHARAYFAAGSRGSLIPELAASREEQIGARHVLEAAAKGDAAALQIMDKPLNHMAAGIANAVSLLNPQMVVIGGGVADSGSYYVNEISSRVRLYTPFPVVIRPALLGNTAGAIGAAAAVTAKSQ